jgi:hypothetical protein
MNCMRKWQNFSIKPGTFRANARLECLHKLCYATSLHECVREVAGHPGVTVLQDARTTELKAILYVKVLLLHAV